MIDRIRFLRQVLPQLPGMTEEVLNYMCSASWILGVTLCDNKHRFQLAGAIDAWGVLATGSDILSFEYIRAKSGHSGVIRSLVNDDTAYSRNDPKYADDISCICRKTQRQLIRDIFFQGLKPGVGIHSGGRKHVNLSPYLPHDPRNVAVGRLNDNYDTVIMFRKNAVIREHELLLSANGIVATTQTLTSEFFQLIYVCPFGELRRAMGPI